jgi:nucleotide-binding universal stress UspA family protein
MYKKIMLALDGSKVSDSLIDEIIKLTKNQDVDLRIIHVIDESLIYYGGPAFDYLSLIAL